MGPTCYMLLGIQVLALLLVLVHSDGAQDDTCSQIPIDGRVECALPSVSPQECINRGCCFDSKNPGAIQCFSPKHKAVCNCAEVKAAQRLPCGNSGIRFEQCRKMGCCYDASMSGAPTCFVKPYEEIIKIEKQPETVQENNGEQLIIVKTHEIDCSKCKPKQGHGLIGGFITGILGSGEKDECKKCKQHKGKDKGGWFDD